VIETRAFIQEAKTSGMSDEEREAVVLLVAADPETGDLVEGTGGCRKLRVAGRGRARAGATA